MKNKKSFLFKLGAIVILLAIAAVMMIIGRGHTVYFDSKAVEYEGKSYECPYKIVVNVNGERVAKLYEDERGMTTCIGQNLKVELVVTQEKGGDEVTSVHTLKLPYNMDGIVINVPAYLAGLPEEVYLSKFVSTVVEEITEEPTTDEFGISEVEQ